MTEPKGPTKRTRKGATPGAAETPAGATMREQDFGPEDVSREAAVEALMRLAAEQPWNDIEVSDIAAKPG